MYFSEVSFEAFITHLQNQLQCSIENLMRTTILHWNECFSRFVMIHTIKESKTSSICEEKWRKFLYFVNLKKQTLPYKFRNIKAQYKH